ncbi:hypothetical protein [Eubacterium callanderi]|uniref:RDAC family protein n=1 Tax=Eubacterium callanderi TaxID=53442 RepID=UPI00398416C0
MIVTFREIGALNQLLQEKHLDYKIHLSDACGSQSMWIESLNNAGNPKANEALYEVINTFLRKWGQSWNTPGIKNPSGSRTGPWYSKILQVIKSTNA